MPRADLTPQARREIDARAGVARQDMGFALASFVRPVVRGKRAYIEGIKQAWMGGTLTIGGPEIDAADLGVLLALLALALRTLSTCASSPGADAPGLLPDTAQRGGTNRAGAHATLTLCTTLAAICKEIGRDSSDGRAHASIRASLRRLAGIVIEGQSGDEWAQTHLIGGTAGRARGTVAVILSYRLTWAVLGCGPHSKVDMHTWRQLSPVAQVLYHWLCGWRPGHGRCPAIRLDTLAGHVWGRTSGGLTRRHRQQIRAALAELPAGEWTVEIVGLGSAAIAEICRTRVEPVFPSTRTRVLEYAPTHGNPAIAGACSPFSNLHKASTQGVEAGGRR